MHAHTQSYRNDLRSETVSATKMSSETFTVSHTPSNSHCRYLQRFMMACQFLEFISACIFTLNTQTIQNEQTSHFKTAQDMYSYQDGSYKSQKNCNKCLHYNGFLFTRLRREESNDLFHINYKKNCFTSSVLLS